MQALGLTFMQGQVLQSAERIRLPKLNDLMTIDYSYHIRAVDRFATLDLKSNYSAISAVADGRRVRNECDAARLDWGEKCKMLQLHFTVRKTAYTGKNN